MLIAAASSACGHPAPRPPTAPSPEAAARMILETGADLGICLDGDADPAGLDGLEGELPPLVDALGYVHRPPAGASLELLEDGRHPAQRRLAFEELLAHHLSLRLLRGRIRSHRAPRLRGGSGLLERFLDALPFELTGAQNRVLQDILADMSEDKPMLRLVQGDVGSGKTVVAAAAAVVAADAGFQAAVMAPTELLAEQHFRTLENWLSPLGVGVTWLTGRLTAKARRKALEEIAGGQASVIVGTHALFQAGVEFARLGLAVIDEQHRFGVHQRLALTEKGGADGTRPHQLVMTATPIPRTLAMSSYADLDTSSIDELPPGRGTVTTVVVPAPRRAEVLERVRLACESGKQAYWVCPLIEESDVLQCQAAEETAAALAASLPDVSVGLVHGRMKAPEKQAVMDRFKAGEIQLLVATTVIEVGVDVPNASLMIIENSERMGLAQLHQLRGRVGRGSADSSCVLMYEPPLNNSAERRLRVLRETNDGFRIAEQDLHLRGPGEVLGTRQTGVMQMRVADLMRDRGMLPEVRAVADRLLSSHADSIAGILGRWIGDAARYGQVLVGHPYPHWIRSRIIFLPRIRRHGRSSRRIVWSLSTRQRERTPTGRPSSPSVNYTGTRNCANGWSTAAPLRAGSGGSAAGISTWKFSARTGRSPFIRM